MLSPADNPTSLDDLERWFQNEIVRGNRRRKSSRVPLDAQAAMPSRKTEEVILPSHHLRAKERVAIYARMYFSRLHDCLREDYPAVARLCGETAFERLTRAYLETHPSRHYSLNVLGRHLPEFIAHSPLRIARRALLADVARLELAMTQVFDERDSSVMKPSDFAALPPSVWENARPRLIAALRVHSFDHRANAIVSAVRKDQSLPELGRKRTWVAVYRKNFVLWRMDLSEPMFAVLRALRADRSLREAIEAGAEVYARPVESLQADVFHWFADWVNEGFFSSIE